MKLATPALFATALFATALAYGAPADDVKAAIKNLSDAANYSWTVTTVYADIGAPPDALSPNNPIDGKTEKDGFAVVTEIKGPLNGRKITLPTVIKGDKVVVTYPGGSATSTWITHEKYISNMSAIVYPPAQKARIAAVPQLPAAEIASLAAKVKEFKAVEGALTGDLSTDDVAPLLMTRIALSIADTPSSRPQNVFGSLRIWLKDGTLARYEVHAKGTFLLGSDSWQVDLTLTTEIKDIGTTKVEVPAGARAKLDNLTPTVEAPTEQFTPFGVSEEQLAAHAVLDKLPPGAQLTDPFQPGRPTVAGQTFIVERSAAGGKIIVAYDKFIGFLPAGNGQYRPVYDGEASIYTPEEAARVKKSYEAESSSVTSVPIGSDPVLEALMSIQDD